MKTLALILPLAAAFMGCAADPDVDLDLDLKDDARRQLADGKADERDACEEHGWYHDSICDQFCPTPDPDCGSQPEFDSCAEHGWYDDDVCDSFCPKPDPDCGGSSSTTSCPNNDSCNFNHDGVCDDGGPGSESSTCAPGTDRTDCGFRHPPNCSGTGPTPFVSSAYYQKGDCDGGSGATASLVVEGSGFEVESQSGLIYGTRRRIGDVFPQPAWNRLSSSKACVTVGGAHDTGKPLSMISLAGKESNAVTITNKIP